jgi:hypothetical protein
VRNTTVFFGLLTEKRLFSSISTRHSGPTNINNKYSTVEDIMESFPHPILPPVEGEPDYQTIHATRKFLQAISRAIDTHLGGGTLGRLVLIISDVSDRNIAPPTVNAPTFWVTPDAPGGHQQQRMEQQAKSAQLATFGKRMSKPIGLTPLSNKH